MIFMECHKRIEDAWDRIFEKVKSQSSIPFTDSYFNKMFPSSSQMMVSAALPWIEVSVAVDVQEITDLSEYALEQLIHWRFHQALAELRDQIDEYLQKYGEK